MGILASLFGKRKPAAPTAPRPAILAIVQDAREFSAHVVTRVEGLFEKDEKDMALSAFGFGAIQKLCEQLGRDSKECPSLCCTFLRKFFGYSSEESERRALILAAAGQDSGSPLFAFISAGKTAVCTWQSQDAKYDAADFRTLYEKLPKDV